MKSLKNLALVAMTSLVLASCGTTQQVPLTGRTHRISVSDEQVLSLSNQEYTKYMASAKKSKNATQTAMVRRVGQRLATAVETYLKQNGFANDLKNYSWEFNLVQDNSANAFCMPGGKIVVYEGLLPYTQNETCLAIVLGHEIAHAVAKHSAEQLSKQQNQQIGTNILGSVLNQAVGSGVGDVASAVAGQYFSFRNLKYSRDNETEADYMGLIFAAMAGYDPLSRQFLSGSACPAVQVQTRVISSVITLLMLSVLLLCKKKCLQLCNIIRSQLLPLLLLRPSELRN